MYFAHCKNLGNGLFSRSQFPNIFFQKGHNIQIVSFLERTMWFGTSYRENGERVQLVNFQSNKSNLYEESTESFSQFTADQLNMQTYKIWVWKFTLEITVSGNNLSSVSTNCFFQGFLLHLTVFIRQWILPCCHGDTSIAITWPEYGTSVTW